MKLSPLSAILVGSLAAAMACRDDASCLRHSDCVEDERCQRGSCVIPPTPGRSDGDAGEGGTNGDAAGAASTESGAPNNGGASGSSAAGAGNAAGAGGAAGSGDAGAAGDAGSNAL